MPTATRGVTTGPVCSHNTDAKTTAKRSPSRHHRRPPQRLYLRDVRVGPADISHTAIVLVELADAHHVPPLAPDTASLAAAAELCLGPSDGRMSTQLAELCPAFADSGDCPLGGECTRIHATRVTPMHPHRLRPAPSAAPSSLNNNDTLLPPQPASYPASVGVLPVARPNEATATMTVDATECFITKAVDTNGVVATSQRPLGLCAHFVMKGLCLFGADCSFVHRHGQSSSQQRGVTSPASLLAVGSDHDDGLAVVGDDPPLVGSVVSAPPGPARHHHHLSSTGTGPWPFPAIAAGAPAPAQRTAGARPDSPCTASVAKTGLPAVAAAPAAATTTTKRRDTAASTLPTVRRFRHHPYGESAGWQSQ